MKEKEFSYSIKHINKNIKYITNAKKTKKSYVGQKNKIIIVKIS